MIRRITIAVLAGALAGAVLAVPALSADGPQAVAAKKAKKKKKKSKKANKGKKGKKKKGCKTGSGGSTSGGGLPGEATPSSPTKPDQPSTLHVASLGLAAGTVLAPNSTTGTVTVDAAAGASGQQVDLESSNSSRVSVPASVVVPPGETQASFSVDTTIGAPVTATLTASIDASNATTQLKVVDTASVTSVNLERRCFTFGTFASNRVSLDVPAPSDTLVSLLSSDPTALSVPAGVTVPSGSTSAFFSVNALADSASVTVTATLGSSEATDSASVSETDPATNADGLTLAPDTVVAGQDSTGTVTLDCEAPPGGTTVTLGSSDPGVGVPVSVLVPAGQLSVNFPITTDPGLGDGQFDVSATAGSGTKHATLTIDSSLPT
ncbi:MAG TPA: hypothetical protein VFN72_08790 [Solirubrobacterales bacterium]|nr:hypothetical protein [Solirubrobacterales bacterium]